MLVCTYEAPRELELVLAALSRQSQLPTEVIVADDGSGAATRQVIDAWRPKIGTALLHVWQRDSGYRKARVMNEAARRATGEHFIDAGWRTTGMPPTGTRFSVGGA